MVKLWTCNRKIAGSSPAGASWALSEAGAALIAMSQIKSFPCKSAKAVRGVQVENHIKC